MTSMRILFLSRWFPYPNENGAKIRIYNLLKGLAVRNTVDLVTFYADEDVSAGCAHLLEFIDDIRTIPYKPFHPGSLKSLLGFFADTPRSVVDTYSREMADTVKELSARQDYDVVIASEIDMAIYGLDVHGPKKVFEELEVTKILAPFQDETHLIRKLRNGLTWWKLSRYVKKILDEYDGTTVVSEDERSAAVKINPERAPVVIPNGVDFAYYQLDEAIQPVADSLIYNGSITYEVNYKAVLYFIEEILPLIQAQRPSVRFYITGKVKQELIDRLPRNEGVVFTGFLDDIRTVLAKSWVNVVPLTVGGGTRLKILKSLAAGVPVISTRVGAEGLDLVHGQDILVADRPGEFADAVLSVLQAPALRNRLAENGRKTVESKYDWLTINQRLDTYLNDLVAS